jgi:hypothetical protein
MALRRPPNINDPHGGNLKTYNYCILALPANNVCPLGLQITGTSGVPT